MQESGLYPVIVGNRWYTAFLLCMTLSSLSLGQSGGQYSIIWSTIDSGGGYSNGGQYIVTGTIGQPDAAYSAGGSHELLGAFWPGEPMCFVEFEDFALFASYWLESGTGLPSDLYADGTVDSLDLEAFAEMWLCYCPYGWPLK